MLPTENNGLPGGEPPVLEGVDCISGQALRLTFGQEGLLSITELKGNREDLPFFGPGLIDVQVNGIHGVDFNTIGLTAEDVLKATQYLLSKGVTTFFPTLITNTDEQIFKIIRTIVNACQQFSLVDSCVGGIHLEGPFISADDGARGAHNQRYIRPPDTQWLDQCQEVSEGRIRLLTLSPEWENTLEFIHHCQSRNVKVAIGHTNTSPEQIAEAVEAGATLSTHLGNAAPLMLRRHPNILWEQLAQDGLYASFIADGFHLPEAFLKVAFRTKGEKAFLVSDATAFSGMAPGIYQSHIGDEVVLEENGRLCMKANPDLLAGATNNLLENVEFLLRCQLCSLPEAWQMASGRVAEFLGSHHNLLTGGSLGDIVLFEQPYSAKVHIRKVYKGGKKVFAQTSLHDQEKR